VEFTEPNLDHWMFAISLFTVRECHVREVEEQIKWLTFTKRAWWYHCYCSGRGRACNGHNL